MNQLQDNEGEPGLVESGISQTPARPSVGLLIACNMDIVVLVLSLPVFIAASLPLVAWAVAAGVWILQRGIQIWVNRKAAASRDARTTVGLLAGSMLGRAWLVAIAIFLVGVNDNTAGLAAAVLIVALFTVYFTMGMIMRPLQAAATRGGPRPLPAAATHGGPVAGGGPADAPAGEGQSSPRASSSARAATTPATTAPTPPRTRTTAAPR